MTDILREKREMKFDPAAQIEEFKKKVEEEHGVSVSFENYHNAEFDVVITRKLEDALYTSPIATFRKRDIVAKHGDDVVCMQVELDLIFGDLLDSVVDFSTERIDA